MPRINPPKIFDSVGLSTNIKESSVAKNPCFC